MIFVGTRYYWIVNLINRRVKVYFEPGPSGYHSQAHYRPGESIPVVLDAIPIGSVAVDDLLP